MAAVPDPAFTVALNSISLVVFLIVIFTVILYSPEVLLELTFVNLVVDAGNEVTPKKSSDFR
jgi:hypothetical protein